MRRTVMEKHTEEGFPDGGTWARLGGEVYVCCPGCGSLAALDHDVDQEGRVTPALQCPSESCCWHRIVKLADWDNG